MIECLWVLNQDTSTRSPVGDNLCPTLLQSTTSPTGATPMRVASNLSPNWSQSSTSDQPGVVHSSATGAECGDETLNVNTQTQADTAAY